jgi:hypothetical protein
MRRSAFRPIDLIVFGRDPIEQAEAERKYFKQQQDGLRYNSLLRDVHELLATIRSSLQPKNEKWPPADTFYLLTKTVAELCRLSGKVKVAFASENFQFLDSRSQKLKLRKTTEMFVSRALKVEARPFERITQLASTNAECSARAKELLGLWPKIERNRINASTVKWEEYARLFILSGKPLVATRSAASGSPTLLCYTRFLELILDDLEWRRKHDEGAKRLLFWIKNNFASSHPLFAAVQKFAVFSPFATLISPVDMARNDRAAVKRELARRRQRSARMRKKAKNEKNL